MTSTTRWTQARSRGSCRILLSLVAVIATLAATAVSVPAAAAASKYPPIPKGPIAIGQAEDLSGALASAGLASKSTFAATVAIVNRDYGGIAGHKIVDRVTNTDSDVTNGVIAARQLVDDNVVAVITPSNLSNVAAQEYPIWQRAHIPMLLDQATQGYIDTPQYPLMFSVAEATPKVAQRMTAFLDSKHATKVAILSDGLSSDELLANDVKASLQKGQHVVGTVTISPGTVAVAPELAKLQADKPDAVVVAVSTGFGPIWDAFSQASWAPVILTSEIAYFNGYSAASPLSANAYTTCSAGLPAGTPVPKHVVKVMDAIEAATPEPVHPDALVSAIDGMDQLLILKAAIEKYHSTDYRAIAAAMESFHNRSFFYDQFRYNFSKKSHAGGLNTGICKLTPLGQRGIPVRVPG